MKRTLAAITAATLVLPLAGCLVSTRNNDNGDKDVAISTPLGGLSVKTDAADVGHKLGLPLYPGAVLQKKKDNDNGSADVNMNFGAFHLRVLAMDFASDDEPSKVEAFYRKALSQYSDVITCRGKQPVGKPVKTGLGLTCSDDNHIHTGTKVSNDDDSDNTELKAGSPSRQHIVSFKPQSSGTRFGIVSLELPRDEKISGDSGN